MVKDGNTLTKRYEETTSKECAMVSNDKRLNEEVFSKYVFVIYNVRKKCE